MNSRFVGKLGLLTAGIAIVIFGYTHPKTIYSIVGYLKNNPTIVYATTIKPEPLTELYFENSSQLPSKISLYKSYSFNFVIHNIENVNKNYTYIVTFQNYGQTINTTTVLDKGTVPVKNGEYLVIPESFGPITLNKTKITVELIDQKQVISFWMIP